MVLSRVAPHGKFEAHIDSYHHVFYFISGIGNGRVGDERYDIRPGRVVEVPSGVEHGYENTGDVGIVLVTINIPVS
ncbi:MAG: cupin domain-containing protein [Candidatus Thorarchaeota archaeon]